MLSHMLDTNICVYVMKDFPAIVRDQFVAHAGRICISSVTYAELRYGAEKSPMRERNLLALDRLTTGLAILPFSTEAAAHFGELKAYLERKGMPCGPFDTQIGAHARSEGLVLVTNNRREFDRMPGLRVENWV